MALSCIQSGGGWKCVDEHGTVESSHPNKAACEAYVARKAHKGSSKDATNKPAESRSYSGPSYRGRGGSTTPKRGNTYLS